MFLANPSQRETFFSFFIQKNGFTRIKFETLKRRKEGRHASSSEQGEESSRDSFNNLKRYDTVSSRFLQIDSAGFCKWTQQVSANKLSRFLQIDSAGFCK
jgi:hypothetical protein